MMKIIKMLKFGYCITHASNCQTHTAEAALWVDLLDVISFSFQLPQLIKWVRYCTHTPRLCLPHTPSLIPPLLLEEELSRKSVLKHKADYADFIYLNTCTYQTTQTVKLHKVTKRKENIGLYWQKTSLIWVPLICTQIGVIYFSSYSNLHPL